MDTQKPFKPLWHRRFDTIVIALIFIVAGGMLLGRNLDLISPYAFHIVISWQMLLIVLGLSSLIKRNVGTAIILLTIGVFFLIPLITGVEGNWFRTYWPIIFIVIGLGMLFKKRIFWKPKNKGWDHEGHSFTSDANSSEDGFVKSDVAFGGTKLIVLEPIFKGADLDVTFGAVSLELRKTTLEAPITYIDVDATFSGIELFIPSHWNVQIECDTVLSGCEDKRLSISEVDYEHKLIIRGDLVFSGLAIKN